MQKYGWMLSVFLMLLPHISYAAGAAGPLYGVRAVVLQSPVIASSKIAADCSVTGSNLLKALGDALQNNGIPTVLATEAQSMGTGAANVDMVPEIVSINDQGLDCTSWLSLTAQSQSNVNVPPVDTLRSVTVVYWREGKLINSSQVSHEHLLEDALQKMAASFAKQYKTDQPQRGN